MATDQTKRGNGRSGRAAPRRIALDETVRAASVGVLTQLLSDTMTLRDLYKKHHWQVGGPTFYELHLLYDKHYAEQVELMDQIAERIQMLGGEGVAFPHDIAETTRIPRPPREAEDPGRQLARLLDAHELILKEAREAVRLAEERNDDGTVDLVASHIIPIHEEQAWFIDQQSRGETGAGRPVERRAGGVPTGAPSGSEATG